VEPAEVRPPRAITVLTQRFPVEVIGRDEPMTFGAGHTTLGVTGLDEQAIRVKALGPGGIGPDVQREVVLHETLHALFYLHKFSRYLASQEQHGEEFIDALAPALLALLRQNPALVRYLLEKP